jgi:hypothetical protein
LLESNAGLSHSYLYMVKLLPVSATFSSSNLSIKLLTAHF